MSSKPPCKRCLLSEVDDTKIYESVKAYVDALPEEMKAELPLYRKRLSICRQCDCLLSGMCAKCGCFVEARAAKKAQKCPFIPAKW